jgi:hypothetical protein
MSLAFWPQKHGGSGLPKWRFRFPFLTDQIAPKKPATLKSAAFCE